MRLSSRHFFFLAVLIVWSLLGCGQKSEEPASQTTSAGPAQAYVTTGDVKVRSGPDTRSETVTEIRAGTKVQVVGREGNWLKVVSKHGNPPGYIDDRFARPAGEEAKATAPVQGIYTVIADTYVRQGPGLHYPVITSIPKGMRVYIVGAEREWLKVQSKHGRAPGYIEKMYAQRRAGG